MFTGLIEDIGTIDALQLQAGGARLTVRSTLATGQLSEVPTGASIAVQGACLTVTEHRRGAFVFDVSRETLARTAFASAQVGQRVHLERAMQLGARLDGHLVQGHIDGLGQALGSERSGDGWTCNYRVPAGLLPYVVHKGSIAIDGVSLTIAELDGDRVAVAVVPHTASNTLLVHHRPGQHVHLETDIIGKYVARLMGFGGTPGTHTRPSGIDAAFLASHGFDRGAHR